MPFRRELDNANLALILVLVVVVAAILGGRGAGALAAVMATLSFDFFLTRPYLSLDIETSDDIETVLILLGVGLLVGEMAVAVGDHERGRERAAEAISACAPGRRRDRAGRAVDDVVDGRHPGAARAALPPRLLARVPPATCT